MITNQQFISLSAGSFTVATMQETIADIGIPFKLVLQFTSQTGVFVSRITVNWNDGDTIIFSPTFAPNIYDENASTQSFFVTGDAITTTHQFTSSGTYSVSADVWDQYAQSTVFIFDFTVPEPTFAQVFPTFFIGNLIPSYTTGNYYASVVNRDTLYYTYINVTNPIFSTSATLNGAGSISALPQLSALGTSTLSGVGTITANGQLSALATSTLSGAGTFVGSADRVRLATASLSGTGTITASAAEIYSVLMTSTSAVYAPADYDGIRVLT